MRRLIANPILSSAYRRPPGIGRLGILDNKFTSMINTNSNLIVSQFTISSPLDQFEVTNLIGLNAPILGYLNLSLTNLGLYSLIVLAVILSLHFVTTNNNRIIPSK